MPVFSYDTFSSVSIILFLYQFFAWDSTGEVFCGPRDLAMADDVSI